MEDKKEYLRVYGYGTPAYGDIRKRNELRFSVKLVIVSVKCLGARWRIVSNIAKNSKDIMKQIFLLCAAMLLTCCSKESTAMAQDKIDGGKTLVVYYSYTGNCKQIAESLTSKITADVMRIEPKDKTQKYEANNYAIGTQLLNAIKAAPNDADSYPEIDPVSITDLSDYQNIIIVTPLWWSQMAAIMQTYLFNYGSQMADKNVGLIVSSYSSGISGVVTDCKRLVPDGKYYSENLWINNSNHSNRNTLIQNWLNTIGFRTQTKISQVKTDATKAMIGIYGINGQRLAQAPARGMYIEDGIKKTAR